MRGIFLAKKTLGDFRKAPTWMHIGITSLCYLFNGQARNLLLENPEVARQATGAILTKRQAGARSLFLPANSGGTVNSQNIRVLQS